MSINPVDLKSRILELVREYSLIEHSQFRPSYDPKLPNWSSDKGVPYAGRVFTEDEVEAAVASVLDFWLTLGHEGTSFQDEFSSFLGVSRTLLVNSGSSANLLAVSALTSYRLPSDRRLRKVIMSSLLRQDFLQQSHQYCRLVQSLYLLMSTLFMEISILSTLSLLMLLERQKL